MSDQLPLTPSASTYHPGLPPAAVGILVAARTLSFTTRIVRSCWGVSVGPKKMWVLRGDCCCAVGALLITNGVVTKAQHAAFASPTEDASILLGITPREVRQFVEGFDGKSPDDQSAWYDYGRKVAAELGLQ